MTTLKPSFLPQSPPWFIGTWAAANGLFALLVLGVTGVIARRRDGHPASGPARLDGRILAQSIGLAVVVAAAAFGLVFPADYFFKTDSRLWVLAIKAFTPDKIAISLMGLPLLAVCFVANSVAINAFNRFALAGRKCVNTAVLARFDALPAILRLVWQYVTFLVTGNLLPWFGGIYSIWLFPVVVIPRGQRRRLTQGLPSDQQRLPRRAPDGDRRRRHLLHQHPHDGLRRLRRRSS